MSLDSHPASWASVCGSVSCVQIPLLIKDSVKGPSLAIPKVLERCGLTKEDVDLYEVRLNPAVALLTRSP